METRLGGMMMPTIMEHPLMQFNERWLAQRRVPKSVFSSEDGS
jgi:hypothetical protein